MKAGDKVVINKGNFNGQNATVLKAFKAAHITNEFGIDVVIVELKSGANVLLKEEHVEPVSDRSISSVLDYGLYH